MTLMHGFYSTLQCFAKNIDLNNITPCREFNMVPVLAEDTVFRALKFNGI